MITDLIINIFLSIPTILLNSINNLEFNISIPSNTFDVIKDITSGISYVFPVYKLLPIAFSIYAICSFKIIWALVLRVKSFIPTMGN